MFLFFPSAGDLFWVRRYNLGVLTRKSHVVVDISFARICSDIISRAVPPPSLLSSLSSTIVSSLFAIHDPFQASSPSNAAVACRMICRLLASTDAAEKLTPEAVPAAAAALKGKERDASESQDTGVLEGKCTVDARD